MTHNQKTILLIRTMHGLITALFLSCIGYVYYAGVTNRPTLAAYIAAGALMVEGIVVILNKGDCPLGFVHHKYGDDKAFFELLLPKRAAKLAVPVLGCIAGIGIALLFF